MSEVSRQIHITPARKEMFDKVFVEGGPFLARSLYYGVLDSVRFEFTRREDGDRILLKQSLSEEKEARLRQIWEITMPPAPHADRIRREEFG